MSKKLIQFDLIEPPAELMGKIINRIAEEHRLIPIKQRIFLFSVGLAGSVIGFFPAFKMLKSGFAESGFLQFFSLIFSDAGILLANWQNFVSSLLETLPVMSLVIFLAVIFLVLEFLKLLSRDIKTMFNKLNINMKLNLWT
ncbi:MAG: hypothetical protein NTX82_01125 [Candidatus Parcubacteria bacterium]|nr:hypothetical protein [Candidatus Parcubacteria bacterium]